MNLPWQGVPLREVMAVSDRAVPVGHLSSVNIAGVYSFGRGLFKRGPIDPQETSYKSYNRLIAGEFVISQPKAWEGALALVTPEFDGWYLSPVFPTFSIDRSRLQPEYLSWFCRRSSVWFDLQQRSRGIGARRETVSPESFLSLEIPLPSVAEQRRILARIEGIAGKIEEAGRLRGEAEEERNAFAYAFLRQVRQRLLRTSFQKARLGSVTRVTAGGTPSRDNPAYWGGDIPWIKTGELRDGDIDDADEKITKAGVDNSSAKMFPPDTVLIALYGQGQTRGRTARLLMPATTNQACCAVLPKPEVLDPLFVQFWLRSLYVELREEAQGGAQPNWNSGMIKDLQMAIPPLDVQREIVAQMEEMQAALEMTKRAQTGASVELDAFLPAVLDKAFRGGL